MLPSKPSERRTYTPANYAKLLCKNGFDCNAIKILTPINELGVRFQTVFANCEREQMFANMLTAFMGNPGSDRSPVDTLWREALVNPGRFPPHVRRVHELAEVERRKRQRFVDQTALGPGLDTLFAARKVIYCEDSSSSAGDPVGQDGDISLSIQLSGSNI